MPELAKQVANERKKAGYNRFVSPFVRASEGEIDLVQQELEAKRDAAAQRGIEEYATPTPKQQKAMNEVDGKAGGVTIKYLRDSPNRRFRELGGMANIRIHKSLVKLAKEHGIGIVLAYGDSDPVFPKKRQNVYTMSKEFKDAGILLVSARGTHGTLGAHPIMPRVLLGAMAVKNEELKRAKETTADTAA